MGSWSGPCMRYIRVAHVAYHAQDSRTGNVDQGARSFGVSDGVFASSMAKPRTVSRPCRVSWFEDSESPGRYSSSSTNVLTTRLLSIECSVAKLWVYVSGFEPELCCGSEQIRSSRELPRRRASEPKFLVTHCVTEGKGSMHRLVRQIHCHSFSSFAQ